MDFIELGQYIAKKRKEKKISQHSLAEDLNISRATISSFENGSGIDIGLKKVLKIIDYLGLELALREKSNFPVFEDLLDG